MMNQHPKTIGVYSDVDLIGYEERFLTTEKPSLLSKWRYDMRRKGTETLKLSIPVRAYIRLNALLEYLPSDYELDIVDILEMLISETLEQYGKSITPRNVFSTVRQMERNAKLKEHGQTIDLSFENTKRTKVKIQLNYKKLLFLEGVMEDMNLAVEECSYTVEYFLTVLFVDFMKRLQAGQVPDLARQIGKHVEGGESA